MPNRCQRIPLVVVLVLVIDSCRGFEDEDDLFLPRNGDPYATSASPFRMGAIKLG